MSLQDSIRQNGVFLFLISVVSLVFLVLSECSVMESGISIRPISADSFGY